MFDMTLYAFERFDGIRLELLYNPDLFDAVRMTEMLDQYRFLLTQAAAAGGGNRQIFSCDGHGPAAAT